MTRHGDTQPTQSLRGEDQRATVGYEAQLWQMADALRGSTGAARRFLESVAR